MTWHNTSHYIASNDVTITWPDPATDIKTSKHFTSKHKTSPPWNSRRLVHSKEMIWASRWSVALRTFYRQILSVLYSSFPFGNFRPRLVRALLVYNWRVLHTIPMNGSSEPSTVSLKKINGETLGGWTLRTSGGGLWESRWFLVSRCLTPRTVHVMCSCDVLEVVHSSAIEVRLCGVFLLWDFFLETSHVMIPTSWGCEWDVFFFGGNEFLEDLN